MSNFYSIIKNDALALRTNLPCRRNLHQGSMIHHVVVVAGVVLNTCLLFRQFPLPSFPFFLHIVALDHHKEHRQYCILENRQQRRCRKHDRIIGSTVLINLSPAVCKPARLLNLNPFLSGTSSVLGRPSCL